MDILSFESKRNRKHTAWIIAGVTLLLIGAFFIIMIPNLSTPVETFELAFRDFGMHLKGVREPEAPIVIVAIDDESINYTGYHWPWPRSYIAQIVNVLNQSEAALIGLDIFLFEPDPKESGDNDLSKALSEAPLSVSVMDISHTSVGETLNLPLNSYLKVLDGVGLTTIGYDDDAAVRSIEAYEYSSFDNQIYFNWAIETARFYLNIDPPVILKNKLIFNNQRISLNGRRLLIDFIGPAGSFPTYSAHQVVLGDIPPETFRNKIVLIGPTTMTLQDMYPTPFSKGFRTPGVEIVANAVNSLISSSYIRVAPAYFNIFLLLITAGIAWWINLANKPRKIVFYLLSSMVGWVIIWTVLFLSKNWYFPLIPLEIMLILGVGIPQLEQIIFQALDRRRMQNLFGRFISPEMVNQLANTQDINSLNKRAILTILFLDIRNFTGISERLDPEDVVKFLNRFLPEMTRIIHKHGGTVDKYIGDAIVAFFGEPIPVENHALNAALAAYEMRSVLKDLRDEWQQNDEFTENIEIGVGINSGEVFVGIIGSEQRINYTVIGDSVNLASRLQDQTKNLNWPILISG
ncbi:MAG: adenylate/guanylate cyclase domain-containing protein, partial [Anaerolineaceae bacterium]|nr:adenylate/guanylate cyclase domain-containing protein [Anaerolineaceae bacterium]